MELKFKGLVYQVLVGEHLVAVIEDFESAMQFAKEYYESVGVVILPIPIFAYTQGKH